MKSLLAELNMRYFNSANGYLITKIAPARVGRIQKALDNLRGKLYALRIEINLIQE